MCRHFQSESWPPKVPPPLGRTRPPAPPLIQAGPSPVPDVRPADRCLEVKGSGSRLPDLYCVTLGMTVNPWASVLSSVKWVRCEDSMRHARIGLQQGLAHGKP